jgi:hypothetical protein
MCSRCKLESNLWNCGRVTGKYCTLCHSRFPTGILITPVSINIRLMCDFIENYAREGTNTFPVVYIRYDLKDIMMQQYKSII